MAQNYGLGRGLSSLIPQKKQKTTSDNIQTGVNYFGQGVPYQDSVAGVLEKKKAENIPTSSDAKGVQEIDIAKLSPNPFQPRKDFNEEKLNELADSIKEHGIIQPIVASRNGENFEIVAGERRFQAAKIAGLTKVPVILREKSDDKQKLELAIVENIQRQDLSSIEEAKSYLKLCENFGLTQEEVAKKLGKNRSSVANKIRLLQLPLEIQKALVEGKITEGHCKLLLAIPNPEKQKAFYEMIIKNSLTVRQTEDKTKEVSVRTHKRNIAVDPEVKSIENELSETLGTKVKLKKSGQGGRIEIEYYSREELNNILEKIK